ncbi:MAG: DUF411 domain-containing protein [Methylomicrobium sp.]|nr:DUF411 domain-containing protein [Methylomicrobium sp.]
MKMNKKLLALIMPLSIIFQSAIAENTKEILVYRSPTCSCCGKWLEHMKQNNFEVKDIVTEDMDQIKAKLGVPKQLASCHTAVIDGYVVEGHVPAADIEKMLKDKPKIAGLSVPGMPMGTPGMEMGGRKDPYQVISFDKDNNQQIYNSYENE